MRSVLLAILAVALAAPSAGAATRSIADAPIRTVDAGQGQIGYRTVGKGRPLVLIMGLSGTMDAWPPTFVDALARRHRVITFDSEGIRQTTLGPGPLTILRMADDTASLMRALHLKRADVLGWSMGGMIAQSLAKRHPRLLRRLVLCATAPGDGHGTPPGPDAIGRLSDPSAVGAFGLLFPPGRDELGQAYLRDIFRYPQLMPQAPSEISRLQLGASATWLDGNDPSGKRPGRLRLPVLIGGGALDRALPVPNQRHLARVLPNARLKVYRDAAHGFLFQHRRDFLRRVERFLQAGGKKRTRRAPA
jgi:pimeloyl-ACP methyl ester carboxylesterase